jgi:hypothetical protein
MKHLLIILVFSSFLGCVSYKGIQLSAFTYNSKKANSRIIGRFPDYGDGHKDGCMIMREMHLNLIADKMGRIEGKVSDVSTMKPINYALVLLKTDLQQNIRLTTDSLGLFHTKIHGKLIEARLDYAGYRGMTVRL